MKQPEDLMRDFNTNFDNELSKNPILATCIAGLIEDLRETNARMDELQKRVEALNKPTQADDVKLSKEQIIDCIKQHMREIGELCKDNDVEYLSLCYLKGRISFHTLENRELDIDFWEEL